MEKPLTHYRQIEISTRIVQTAFGHVRLGVADLRAQPHVDARGCHVAGGVGGAGLLVLLIHQVFEIDLLSFKCLCFGVSQIVGDHVDSV